MVKLTLVVTADSLKEMDCALADVMGLQDDMKATILKAGGLTWSESNQPYSFDAKWSSDIYEQEAT